ncbi:DNA-3-methyladenine glycosylase [Lysobacter korlensis]|uniref:Putative 3-methyladenine DNA glycosylase n=1 Tax=Lysobacter korlensis TaxID=553636 RepID=A0ABV6S1U8_9GAMM
MFDRSLLEQSATEVAPRLLGSVVRHGEVAVRLTELEAYLGHLDPGSHAFRGQTPRNAVMFGRAGHLYTYFTYGMHVCANIVCGQVGTATAVLLRAGEVVEGVELARLRRTTSRKDTDLAQGPARLAVALGITLEHGGSDLAAGPVRLELADTPSVFETGPRTGVAGPGGGSEYPWRYWIPGDPTVSPYKAHTPKRRVSAVAATPGA